VLDRVAVQIEKEANLKRRVKTAMIYPSLVITFACLVLTAMLLFIVPVFEKLYVQLGGKLPMLTQWIINASDLLRTRWYIIFPAIGLAIYGFTRWKRTENGRKTWDALKLRVPMRIGDIVLKVTMARFSRTLSTLVTAGVDIIKALEITATTAGNWVVEDALRVVRERVHAGAPIAQPLVEHPVFPPMVSQMVKIGEETGELDAMLGKIADFYEEEVDASISALTSIIEPIMIILVGVMVGTIILAMYLPMFKLLTLIK
jgi:type IV pilus assembly protein PilC